MITSLRVLFASSMYVHIKWTGALNFNVNLSRHQYKDITGYRHLVVLYFIRSVKHWVHAPTTYQMFSTRKLTTIGTVNFQYCKIVKGFNIHNRNAGYFDKRFKLLRPDIQLKCHNVQNFLYFANEH